MSLNLKVCGCANNYSAILCFFSHGLRRITDVYLRHREGKAFKDSTDFLVRMSIANQIPNRFSSSICVIFEGFAFSVFWKIGVNL